MGKQMSGQFSNLIISTAVATIIIPKCLCIVDVCITVHGKAVVNVFHYSNILDSNYGYLAIPFATYRIAPNFRGRIFS